MNNIIEEIKNIIINDSLKYKEESQDHYDFWNNHIKYVYEESIKLANEYSANLDIVKLGALLHDIALIRKVGDRKDHHINGAKLAEEILDEFSIDSDVKERVLSCVYNHRSSKNAENIEELCVADADILAHFDNIPMLFNSAFVRNKVNLNEINEKMLKAFEDDYNDLSDKTKETFKERFALIKDIVLGIKRN